LPNDGGHFFTFGTITIEADKAGKGTPVSSKSDNPGPPGPIERQTALEVRAAIFSAAEAEAEKDLGTARAADISGQSRAVSEARVQLESIKTERREIALAIAANRHAAIFEGFQRIMATISAAAAEQLTAAKRQRDAAEEESRLWVALGTFQGSERKSADAAMTLVTTRLADLQSRRDRYIEQFGELATIEPEVQGKPAAPAFVKGAPQS
jgi:hypothetical protein